MVGGAVRTAPAIILNHPPPSGAVRTNPVDSTPDPTTHSSRGDPPGLPTKANPSGQPVAHPHSYHPQ